MHYSRLYHSLLQTNIIQNNVALFSEPLISHFLFQTFRNQKTNQRVGCLRPQHRSTCRHWIPPGTGLTLT